MAILRARSRRSVSLVLAALMLAAAVSAGSIYQASSSTHAETYYACLYSGSLSQVGTTEPSNCGRGRVISWPAGGDESVSWNDLTDIPADFQDGKIAWSEVICPEDPSAGGCIQTSNLRNNAVTSDKINDGAVQTADLAPGTVVGGFGGVVQDGSITGDDLALSAVVGGFGGDVADGSITADDLALNAVVGGLGGDVQDGSISSYDLADDSVRGGPDGVIAQYSITWQELAQSSVSGGVGGTIADGSITTDDIADGSITADDLANGSVPTSKQVANASQGYASAVSVLSGGTADVTAPMNAGDSASHLVQIISNALVMCTTCDPTTSATLSWTLLADGVPITDAGPYGATLYSGRDTLTIAQTVLHSSVLNPGVTYTLRVTNTGPATVSLQGFSITAVDLGLDPTP